MRAVDTNVLIRLLARDDDEQTAKAEDFVEKGAWIGHLVLAETSWVLSAVYGLDAERIARAIEMLLEHEHLVIQDADAVAAALEHFRRYPGLGFSDCLIVEAARRAGHLPLGTFDQDLGRLDGAQAL
jgi:predicted nucleic-acid-binding protein